MGLYQTPGLSLARWLGWSAALCTRKLAGLIPGQGTYLGRELDPQFGCIWEANNECFSLTMMSLSLSLSVSLPLSPSLSPPSRPSSLHILGRGFKKKENSWAELFLVAGGLGGDVAYARCLET